MKSTISLIKILFLFSWDRGASIEDRDPQAKTKAITAERHVVIWALNTNHSAVESTCAALCIDKKEKLKMAVRTLAIREDSRNGLK